MDNLRLVIGPAPSELSEPELLAKITARQQLVAAQLQAFREHMSTQVVKPAPKLRAAKAKGSSGVGDVGEFMEELKRLGMTMEEFRAHLAAKKQSN